MKRNIIPLLLLILCSSFVKGQTSSLSILICNELGVGKQYDSIVLDSSIAILSVYPSYLSLKNIQTERKMKFKKTNKGKSVEYLKYSRAQDLNYYTFCYYTVIKQSGIKVAFIELQIPSLEDMVKYKANPIKALDRTINYLKGHSDAFVVLLGSKNAEVIEPYLSEIIQNKKVNVVVALPDIGHMKSTFSVLGFSSEEERIGWIRLIKSRNSKGVESVSSQEINWL